MIKKYFRSIVEYFPSIALFLRNVRDQLNQRQSSIKTPWGFSLAGHDVMARGEFEPQETKLVRKLLEEVDVLVNIGANIGYYCCHALNMNKHVIAVEPIARNMHYLLKDVGDNGWSKKAEVFQVALGKNTDISQMWGGGTGASLVKGWASNPESYVTNVSVVTLDRLLGDTLHGKRAFIVVDIEGAEYMMLQGATKILVNTPRPIWLVEVSTTEHQPAGTPINPSFSQTFDTFFSQGYRAYTADDLLQEVTNETVTKVVSGQHQLDTHNFVFR